jgi:putative Mn2+ efflux pump MntP
MAGTTPAVRLRVSVLFTYFEAAMPLVGVALGAPLGHAIGNAADYVAVGVLLAFGPHTLLSADDDEVETVSRLAEVRGAGALLLGASASMS